MAAEWRPAVHWCPASAGLTLGLAALLWSPASAAPQAGPQPLRIFVSAEQRPPAATVTTLDQSAGHLRENLRRLGFTIAESTAGADATATVLARRQRQAVRIRSFV